MKKSSLWVAIALMMAMTTVGCSKDNDTITNVPQPEVVTPADPEKPAESEKSEEPFVPHFPDMDDLQLTRGEMDMVQESNDFAFNLFREATADYNEKVAKGNNILSPVSIIYALGMLNNGATGETQQQINKVLGFADGVTNSVSIHPLQFSVSGAAGAEFRFSPQLSLYAEPGLGYWFDNGSDIPTYYQDKPLSFSLSLGLRLNLWDNN